MLPVTGQDSAVEICLPGVGLMIGIRLFGPTAVEIDGELLPGVAVGRRPRQILEILALSAGMPVGKDRLADLLWEGNPPASFAGTLESYVCLLRRGLGLGSGRGSVLATTSNGYLLDADRVHVDLMTFRRLLVPSLDSSAGDAVEQTVKAMLLVTGELLASEPYAAWAAEAREVARREVVAACVNGARMANGIGDARRAIGLAHFAIAHDRLCEEAWQHLMRVHWLAGQRGDALRAYAELRAAMLDELGEEPGPESRELYLAILRDNPTGRADSSAGEGVELRMLLRLLRQTLDGTPGVQAPARDAELSGVALTVLERPL